MINFDWLNSGLGITYLHLAHFITFVPTHPCPEPAPKGNKMLHKNRSFCALFRDILVGYVKTGEARVILNLVYHIRVYTSDVY